MTKEEFHKIADRLAELLKATEFEGNCYVVGGAVRDFVMGEAIKDIDLCATLPNGGIRLSEWLHGNGLLVHEPVVYPTYGTTMFRLKDFPNEEIEAVHTRKEQYKDKNSRNPETCYGTLEEDAFRRDLTINSLYYNISTKEVIDPTGKGLEDIKNQRIRITNGNPDIVLNDDPLRVLRVVRFASRYGWEIEEETWQSLKRNASRLSIISQERITDEFGKMITCNNPVMALEMLKETGAMKYVIPELEETYGLKQNKYHFGDVWEHTLKTVGNTPNNLVLRVAALLHDIGKINCRTVDDDGNVHFYQHELYSAELCDTILRRMKYPNGFIKQVKQLVKNHMRTKAWKDDCSHMRLKSLRKMWYELGSDMDLCLELVHADNMSHAPEYCMPNQVGNIRERIKEMKEEGIDMAEYSLPVNGKDVMDVLMISPCEEVRKCLDWLLKFAFADPKTERRQFLYLIKKFRKETK